MELRLLVALLALYPQAFSNSMAGSQSMPLLGTATLIIVKMNVEKTKFVV
jgi:hypothetical protein